jgi:hypothetical protein
MNLGAVTARDQVHHHHDRAEGDDRAQCARATRTREGRFSDYGPSRHWAGPPVDEQGLRGVSGPQTAKAPSHGPCGPREGDGDATATRSRCSLRVLTSARVEAHGEQAAVVGRLRIWRTVAAAHQSVRIVGRGLEAVAVRAGRPRRASFPRRPRLALRASWPRIPLRACRTSGPRLPSLSGDARVTGGSVDPVHSVLSG